MDTQCILANLPLRRRCFFLTDRACMLSCWSEDALRSTLLSRVRAALSKARAQLSPPTLLSGESEDNDTVSHALQMLQCAVTEPKQLSAAPSAEAKEDVCAAASGSCASGERDNRAGVRSEMGGRLNCWDEGIEELLLALEMRDLSCERVTNSDTVATDDMHEAEKGGVRGEVIFGTTSETAHAKRLCRPSAAAVSPSSTAATEGPSVCSATHRIRVRELLNTLVDIFYAHGEIYYAKLDATRENPRTAPAAGATTGAGSSRPGGGDAAPRHALSSRKRGRDVAENNSSKGEKDGGGDDVEHPAGTARSAHARVTWSIAAPLSTAVHAMLIFATTSD